MNLCLMKPVGGCVRAAAAIVLVLGVARAEVSVLTANYDNARTNSNTSESTLKPSVISTKTFGKLGTFPTDGQIYAQPLFVPGVQVAGQGKCDVVYIATMHNSVYALDAGAPQSTTPLWTVNLGPSIPSAVFSFSDILPEVGILSTPVIDPARGVIYVVANTLVDNVPVFQLHALSLADGSEMLNGPVTVSASVPGNGPGASDDGIVAFDAFSHLQRPGLVLLNGTVYLSFGSHADLGNFHGWLIGYDAANLQHKKAVVNTTPNGWGGSIWQAGRAPVADPHGNLFVVTGNGDYDGDTLFGESLLRFTDSSTEPSRQRASIRQTDWFTPQDWDTLNNDDWDFGSSGVMMVPGTNLLVAGAKSGKLYLVPSDSLGHVGAELSGKAQAVQVNQWGLFDMALWTNQSGPIIYELEPRNALRAFQIVNGQLNPNELSEYDTTTFFGGIAVSANGGANGSGVVWFTTKGTGQNGTLHALDAGNLGNELWNSDLVPDRDTLGRFAKFVAPTVANGRVYVATFSNTLVTYGLLGSTTTANGAPQVTAVVNGASFLGNTVAPGEVIAIFGNNLGPAQLTNALLDTQGKLTTSLAGTQVLFDGVPVPLLYTSSTQVGAVAPFALANGATTQVQVIYQGGTSAAIAIPVTASAPALFSTDGTGGGFGALNQDGTQNGWANPASAGTVVAVYATGLGAMSPASLDGSINVAPLAAPALPVSVYFNGQPGQVIYAGAAPGMVAGVVQINAIVPDSMSADYNVQVTVQAGDTPSPNAVTLDVE